MTRRFKSWANHKRVKSPRDWSKITHARSFTGTVNGSKAFNVTEVTPETQLRIVDKRIKRRSKQIEGYKRQERFHQATLTNAKGEKDGGAYAAELRVKIDRGEKAMRLKYFNRELLVEKCDKRAEKQINKIKNESAKHERTKQNHERIDQIVAIQGPVAWSGKDFKPPEVKKMIVKNPKGGRTVKTVMQPRFETQSTKEDWGKAPQKKTLIEKGKDKNTRAEQIKG